MTITTHATTATVAPEFGPIPRSGRDPVTGLTRGTCYNLEKAGAIRLVRIRKPGQILGRCLIDYASVRKYFAKLAREQSAERGKAAAADNADSEAPAPDIEGTQQFQDLVVHNLRKGMPHDQAREAARQALAQEGGAE